MNMFYALIGFGSFVTVLTLIGVIGYLNADAIERCAKNRLQKNKPAN